MTKIVTRGGLTPDRLPKGFLSIASRDEDLCAIGAHGGGDRGARSPAARALHCRCAVGPGPNTERGFTLVEMMIVVAIVGILAALAVVGYRSLVLSSHMTEATNTV